MKIQKKTRSFLFFFKSYDPTAKKIIIYKPVTKHSGGVLPHFLKFKLTTCFVSNLFWTLFTQQLCSGLKRLLFRSLRKRLRGYGQKASEELDTSHSSAKLINPTVPFTERLLLGSNSLFIALLLHCTPPSPPIILCLYSPPLCLH